MLRLKCDTRVEVAPGQWPRLDELGLQPGQQCWLAGVRLGRSPHCQFGPVNVALIWAQGEAEPWYLLTDLDSLRQARHQFAVRGWCEQVWRDFKSHGFDLEATALQTGKRLERLLLGMAFAMVWVLWLGAAVIRRGWRRRVDGGSRRKLSLFQIGLRWLEHCWALGQAFPCLAAADHLELSL